MSVTIEEIEAEALNLLTGQRARLVENLLLASMPIPTLKMLGLSKLKGDMPKSKAGLYRCFPAPKLWQS